MWLECVNVLGIIVAIIWIKKATRDYFWAFFHKSAKAFDVPYDRLCKMSILSHFSYKDPENVSHFENEIDEFNMIHTLKEFIYNDKRVSFIDTSTFSQNGVMAECYMWVSKQKLYVIFRGTESIEDWQTNMDLRIKNLPIDKNVKVHQGFYRQFKSIESNVTRKIKDKKNTDPFHTIVFAGHSLGGAIASIATYYFYHIFEDQDLNFELYTFGCPRVGNASFATFFNPKERKKIVPWRIFHFEDTVSMVPVRGCFQHIHAHSLCLREDSCMYIEPAKNPLKDLHWYWRPFHILSCTNYFNVLNRHKIGNYTHILNTFRKQKKGNNFLSCSHHSQTRQHNPFHFRI